MSRKGRYFEFAVVDCLAQLYQSVLDEWKDQNIDPQKRFDQIAGIHASGQKPKQSRKSPKDDAEGRPQYYITIYTVRFRYAVDDKRDKLLINLIDPPPWT